MSNRLIKITFICAVWNEFKRAPNELENLTNELKANNLLDSSEIIIIDNFSKDGTREWALEQENEFVKVILNEKNIGKGGSIKKAISHAKGTIGVIYDLDAEYLSSDAIQGIKLIKKSRAAIVLASRTLDGRAEYVYLQNYLGVRLITELINFLYDKRLTDTATGLKILDLNFYKRERIVFNGFNVDFELVCLALNKNKKVKEFNGQYFPRSKKEGKKIKALRDGFSSLIAIIRSSRKINKNDSMILNMIRYLTQKSAFRYFRVGFLSSILDIIIFIIAIKIFSLGVFTSNLIAFPFAFILNYYFKIESVFCKNSRFSSSKELYLILTSSFIGMLINSSIIVISNAIFTLIFSKILAILPTFLWNYFIRRFFIYRKVK